MQSPNNKWKLAAFFTPLCVIGFSCLLAALYFYTNLAAKDGWNDLIANIFLMIAVGAFIVDGLLKLFLRNKTRHIWIIELITIALAFIIMFTCNG